MNVFVFESMLFLPGEEGMVCHGRTTFIPAGEDERERAALCSQLLAELTIMETARERDAGE